MVEYVNYEEDKTIGPKLYHIGKYNFSTTEIFHLTVALIMICSTLMVFNWVDVKTYGYKNFILLNFFTIGLGFLLHEMGHKLVAQHYGFISEFRADFFMLAFAFVLAIFSPFIFLAPGAVMILGRLSKKQNGIISVAGPLVNLVLGLIFIAIAIIFHPSINSVFGYTLWLGIWVNGFLGVFNMLPFWVLDGKKVLEWNKIVYFVVLGALILLLVASFNHWII